MSRVQLARFRHVVRCVALISLFVAGATVPSQAQTPDREAALKQRMRVLEARLQYLEEKLTKFERDAAQEGARKAQSENRTGADNPAGKPGGKSGGKSKVDTAAPAGGQDASKPATGDQQTAARTGETPAEAAANAVKDSTAQETFVLRDQSPTLKKGKSEASIEFGYMTSSAFLQTDRVWSVNATARYGIMDGLELSAAMPYYNSVRTTNTGPGLDYLGSVNGFGSGSLGLSYSLFNQTPDLPGVAVSVTGIYPGTVSPYDFSHFSGNTSPVNILNSVQGSGHWGIGASAVAYKIVDPLLVFVGGGLTYYFPANYSGYNVEPSLRYTANMGFSFALSEKTTLAFQMIGFYQPDLYVNNIPIPQTFQEQYLARFVVTQRVYDDVWVEPNVTVGLTKNSPDVNFGAVVRKRW